MAVAVVSNTLDSKIQSLFLGEDKPSQGHRNATKYVIKYRTNCYPAAAGSVCFRPMSNPKISALDLGLATWVACPCQSIKSARRKGTSRGSV